MRLLTNIIFLAIHQLIFCQNTLPILKANSQVISIKEGDYFFKNNWGASSEVELDTYVTNKFDGEKEITFYSDIDSLSFIVEPNKEYNFIILLSGKDKAYTQIKTYVNEQATNPVFDFYRKNGRKNIKTDTLLFTVGSLNRIHLTGKINNSESIDFIFDTGASANVIRTAVIGNKVDLKINGTTTNNGADGVTTKQTSSNNVIEIGGLIWEGAEVFSIEYKKPRFDAVLGWPAFEHKILEINYEKQLMVVHKELKVSNEYTKVPMRMFGGTPYIEISLFSNGKESKGWFGIDTGFNKSILVSEKFTKEHNLLKNAKIINESTFVGSAGIPRKKMDIILSKLKIGTYEMYILPISIIDKDAEGVNHNNYLGGELLKRFNIIIDFKNNYIYLKPNKLIHLPFKEE